MPMRLVKKPSNKVMKHLTPLKNLSDKRFNAHEKVK
jgi:hypothetical protein